VANGRGCRPTVCRDCGALALDGYRISFRHLCEACGIRRQVTNTREIHARSGPAHDKWRASMLAGLGVTDEADD
jgi:hypothetical protein